jgi:amino acid adenylation domain-containing protein
MMIQMVDLDLNNYSCENLGLTINSHQLAYTIYTSGSTGQPKGVMIEHHSVINLNLWVNSTFNINQQDRLIFITSICFDLSVYDIFGVLFSGGSIIVAEQHEILDLSNLASLLKTYKATFWDSVPTTLDFLIRGLESSETEYIQTDLRLVFLSGDWIPVNLPGRIKKFFPNAQVISLGGATEATVWSNFYPITNVYPSWKSIPYGRPIANNFFYILDEKQNQVPDGEQGELYIGGVGVAKGYANDKEKSDYSFIADPFNRECGGRMYRTGDIGRMLPDGNMEFLGRKDQQVKIRGFRVELGEIESVIRQYEFVDHAIVLAKDIDGIKRLVGYIVPKEKYSRENMISFIREKLPVYMVPGLWLEIDELPLNANGKIDRKGLPDIQNWHSEKEIIAPKNDAEKEMVSIWKKILGLPQISIRDNFFDLGGQSLLVILLLTEIEKKYKKKVRISTFLKFSTIESLVSHLHLGEEGSGQHHFKSLVAIKATGTKLPLYIIPGDGMNLVNFRNLAGYLDKEQPFYSLQPKGLDGFEESYNNIKDIASHYISEILLHNPEGPYALAGYSFGGYVAIEIKRQLENQGKIVKMIGIFDTDADNLFYKKGIQEKLFKKVLRQIPKSLFILRTLMLHPSEMLAYQKTVLRRNLKKRAIKIGAIKKTELKGFDAQMQKVNENHFAALQKYAIQPFKGKLHLFKAKVRIYFVDDFKYLGWLKFAPDGVIAHEIPGDHKTMFLDPNVKDLARELQKALDDC